MMGLLFYYYGGTPQEVTGAWNHKAVYNNDRTVPMVIRRSSNHCQGREFRIQYSRQYQHLGRLHKIILIGSGCSYLMLCCALPRPTTSCGCWKWFSDSFGRHCFVLNGSDSRVLYCSPVPLSWLVIEGECSNVAAPFFFFYGSINTLARRSMGSLWSVWR